MITQLDTRPLADCIRAINQQGPDPGQLVLGLEGSSRAVLLAQAYQAQPRPMLALVASESELDALYHDLDSLLAEDQIMIYPGEENLALEFAVSSNDLTASRVEVQDFLISGQPGIVLTNISAFRRRLSPLSVWQEARLDLAIGSELELKELEQTLNRLGYKREGTVYSPGEYAIRGGIVDLYPLNSEYPIRLDFFDIELDSIRSFDPESQESIANLDQVRISPAQDIIFPLEAQQDLLPQLQDLLHLQAEKIEDDEIRQKLMVTMQDQLERLATGEPLAYASAYLSLYDPQGTSMVDYLADQGTVWFFDYGLAQQKSAELDQANYYWYEQKVAQGDLLADLPIKRDLEEVLADLKQVLAYVAMTRRGLTGRSFAGVHQFSHHQLNPFYAQMDQVKLEIDGWLKRDWTIQVLVSSQVSAQKFLSLFEEYQIAPVLIQDQDQPYPDAVNILVANLTNGFEFPMEKWVVLTERELLSQPSRRAPKRRSGNLSNAERIKEYNELNPDDYVVHINHGIGRYTGIETLEIDGIHKDLLAIEYEEGARVLLPVDQIDLLRKYVASEGKEPTLNKLGGTRWAKTKQRVQASVEDIADDLINLYAKRKASKGFAFSPDTPEQYEFEEAFPYVETPDQLQSVVEIKADMESEQPMDRLLIGDVGYGKTEVAMRAIFKACMDGKQVAFLVPTTVLAQQHYTTLLERFQGWPFEIEMLSRFVSKKDQDRIISDLAIGKVSVVVGTHRLLSKDIKYHDLGLLIIDEEQRFGVKHKERIKQLRAEVDVLTLTATPIPRTLHMSMIGLRDLSVIETPPTNRFPVQTYVMEHNWGAVRSAIERELDRGGQVFYLHNRVNSIYQRAQEISEMIPEAEVAVAHGQMSEIELENVLYGFVQGDYDVLVTTTIIETGVDIPNANTLIVDDADRMGLSQLYQLRGRVGRTHRIAYAYITYNPYKQLSEESERRLNAIAELTELGSGFKIAMRDLSLRGAGNLLGQQQSGFVDSVGYDLYTDMLNQAINSRLGRSDKQTAVQSSELEWNVRLNAYLPTDYIGDERQKINLYKTINQIDSVEAYREVQDQLIDRFGEFPDAVSNLLDVALIKRYGLAGGIESIQQKDQVLWVRFNEQASGAIKGPKVFELLQDVPCQAEVKLDQNKLMIGLKIGGLADYQWLNALIKLSQAAYENFTPQAEREEVKS